MPKIILQDGTEVEISQDSYDELAKAVNREWPQGGDLFYYVDAWGGVDSDLFIPRNGKQEVLKKRGNFFKTKKDAEMHALRIESLSWNYFPKKGEAFWLWEFELRAPVRRRSYLGLPCGRIGYTKTEERCQEWGDRFAHAWEYLYKSN